MVHFSLSLSPIPADFDLDSEYIQSLMMLVALVLALGFSVLVLLALFLCLVISCMQPVNWPSTAARLTVIAVSCTLAISAGMSVTSNKRFASGLTALLNSTKQLEALSAQVWPAARQFAHTPQSTRQTAPLSLAVEQRHERLPRSDYESAQELVGPQDGL